MTRHFITFLALALVSYALLCLLRGEPDIPLTAWVLIWLGVAFTSAILVKLSGWIGDAWRRHVRK